MNHLPLTRPAPFEEFPATGMETLFPELAAPGDRPVEITVTVPDGKCRRCVMDIVVAQAEAGQAFAVAFRECTDVPDFEITVRRFTG